MAKRKRPAPGLPLFDLPLHPETDDSAAETETAASTETEATAVEPPVGPGRDRPGRDGPGRDRPGRDRPGRGSSPQTRLFDTAEEREDETEPAAAEPTVAAPLVERLQAGLADLAIHVLMVAVAITAAYRLGVRITWAYWPPFTVLTLVFSFLYWVIPLAFWGQTPGMAWVGHLARSLDDEPLTFYQTFLRWLGALFTCGFAGLPLLLALGGSSLSDRLSQSKTISV